MEFAFAKQEVFQNSIEIENVGNFGIEALNDDGTRWYLIVSTSLGISNIFTYGPMILDSELDLKSFKCSIEQMDFSEIKLKKMITSFLCDRNKKITIANTLDSEEILSNCKNPINTMMNIIKGGEY